VISGNTKNTVKNPMARARIKRRTQGASRVAALTSWRWGTILCWVPPAGKMVVADISGSSR